MYVTFIYFLYILMRRKRRNKENGDDDNGFAAWGGYMEAKKTKLMEQYKEVTVEAAEKVSDIFKGISILVNGYTKPSAEELKILMAQHGGIFHMYQMHSTTHIIASNLPNVKINKLGNVPIVKPGWIEDSISLGRLLDYSNYLLYTNQSKRQPALNFPVLPKEIENDGLSKDGFDCGSINEENGTSIDKVVNSTSNENVNHFTDQKVDTSITKTSSKPTKTASDPKFLSEFYNNSRLHLIATLGAEFKQLVNELREKSNGEFPGLQELIAEKSKASNSSLKSSSPIIMHIDMDCFFVSVGLKNRPELRGQPVAVTHSKGGAPTHNTVDRSVEIAMYIERLPEGATPRLQDIDNTCSLSEIASCSYEARRCGIKNGMFMGAALKLCPQLIAIPYDFEGYREVSNILYRTIAEYTLNIEAVSCDEMYVDCSEVLALTGLGVEEWASYIRGIIAERTGCPCSTGFGSNRLQARMATKKAKPNGQFYLKSEDVEEYMSETSLSELPGVGRATLAKLQNLGLMICADVQSVSLNTLQKEVGAKAGQTIYDQARGIDTKPLQYEHERKSVSAEVNYGIRFQTVEEAINFLNSLAVEVQSRLADTGMKAKCITLKLMVRAQDAPTETAKYLGHGICDSLSRSSTLPSATDDAKIIFQEAKILYEKLGLPFGDLRGVGIQLSRLEKAPVINKLLQNFLNQSPKKKEKEVTTTNIENTTKEKCNKNESNKTKSNSPEKNNRRGPVKGKKNGKKTITRTKSNDLSNYFKVTNKDRPIENKKSEKVTGIDPEVLKELPEDIRNEIIRDYHLKEKPVELKKVEQKKPTIHNSQPAGPSSVNMEDPAKKIEDPKSKSEQNFSMLSFDNFKAMLRSWLKTESKPLNVDVQMLAEHFRELAMKRNIEKLHVLLKFLYRNINNKNNCDWHDVYFVILNMAQEGMLMTYGNTLLVPRTFDCPKHQ